MRVYELRLTFFAVFSPEACVRAVAVDLPKLDGAVSSIEAGVLLGAQILQIVMNAVAVEKRGRHLAHLQVGDQTHEGRLVFHRAGRERGQAYVRGNPPYEEVADDGHFFALGTDFGHFGFPVHHQHGLAVVSGEQDHVPAVVVDAGLHLQAGRLGTVDGESELKVSFADEQLQEVTVPTVVQVQNQSLAHVGLQAEAELPD